MAQKGEPEDGYDHPPALHTDLCHHVLKQGPALGIRPGDDSLADLVRDVGQLVWAGTEALVVLDGVPR